MVESFTFYGFIIIIFLDAEYCFVNHIEFVLIVYTNFGMSYLYYFQRNNIEDRERDR